MDLLENFRTHDGVDLHLFELFRRQLARLGDDVLGDRELADVMKQRGGAQRLFIFVAQAQVVG